jgi:RNA polymerase sigma factor (sigma-70 family)
MFLLSGIIEASPGSRPMSWLGMAAQGLLPWDCRSDKKVEKFSSGHLKCLAERRAMSDSFADLLERVRRGDQEAAATLVRDYEPAIRRAVRFRLTQAHLRTSLESLDICQSVLGSFFIRAASGQYDLKEPADLLKLLTAMARNKLKHWHRKQHAQRRDPRRVEAAHSGDFVARDATPSRQIAARELLHEAQQRLSPEERQLAEWRSQGLEWADIAARLSASPEALRKKLTRALDRVAAELGIDEAGDG